MEPSKVGRRRFLKYVGAGLVAATAAGAGCYLYSSQRGPPPTQTTTTTQTPIVWKPPAISEIQVKPRYINPTPADKVEFSYLCFDTGNNPLSTTWLIDGRETSHERAYSTKLFKGDHSVVLKVSDGKSEATKYASVMVEPDQIYPPEPLHVRYKGIRYSAGIGVPGWEGIATPSGDEMQEHLDTIHDELGCNAICIDAGPDYEDNLIECGRLAIEKGFERIDIQPRYINCTIDETIENVGRFAKRARELRQTSEAVVYHLGHEFVLETSGIVPGNNWFQRLDYCVKNPDWPNEATPKLTKMFKDLIKVCQDNYGYPVSYAAIAVVEVDVVPWHHPAFGSIGVDAYLQDVTGWDEDWVISLLTSLKKYRKPVHSTEAGCLTFSGAAEIGGVITFGVWEGRQYDEEEQARYIERYCNMLNKARIDGYFYTQYNDTWDKGYGLYNGRKRKKGFYMYKSYQRAT
jgi:hypothetical protein